MKIYTKLVIKIDSGDVLESESFEYEGPLALANPSGGGGGGGQNAHITTTTTNPVVPDDMKALADAMKAISTGMMGAPVNFGAIPGLDAPKAGPLIPNPSMGAMFSSAPFMMGMNRMGLNGRARIPQGAPRLTKPMPTSWGDLFSQLPPGASKPPMPQNPYMNAVAPQQSQERLAAM